MPHRLIAPPFRPNGRRIDTVPTPQAWISLSPASLGVVSPLKARARDALHAVLRSTSRPAGPDAHLMARGAERC
jgi:hypothetical protein